jgi:hypothetical protein
LHEAFSEIAAEAYREKEKFLLFGVFVGWGESYGIVGGGRSF